MTIIALGPDYVERIEATYVLDNGRTFKVTCDRDQGWLQTGASPELLQRTERLTKAVHEALVNLGDLGYR